MTDVEFEKKLRDDVYLLNVDSTRFLLCYYENKFSTKEIHTDLWERDNNNKYIWTVEHIFPEGENVPEPWVTMIAQGNKEEASVYRENYTHKLGNLTITGYNQNLSNLSFENKKNRKKDDKYIGYKNGLKLNEDVVGKDKWTVEDITERTNKLVEIFIKEFKL